MIKLSEVTAAMTEHKRRCSPGSECEHWQDYVSDCHDTHGHAPWDGDCEVSESFAAYWLEVALSCD